MNKVIGQLAEAGLLSGIRAILVEPKCVYGYVDDSFVARLKTDDRFLKGPLHALHKDVGPDRTDFRSIKGTFGRGSLQIVISQVTYKLYADIDRFNPYEDVAGWFGHTYEMLRGWFK